MALKNRPILHSFLRRPARGLAHPTAVRRLALHLEKLEDRFLMDGAGFVNTDPPEDPDTIVGAAGIVAEDDHRETRQGTIQLRLAPLNNDQLPDGSESLRIKSVSQTKLGNSVTITEDGQGLIYDAGEDGLQLGDTFYYIVESDDGKLGKANVNLSLEKQHGGGGPTPRHTTSDEFDVVEDSDEALLDVLRNDREFRDGEIIAVAFQSNYYNGPLDTSPPSGSIRIADDGKALYYQPAQGFSGYESYTYTVRNESGEEASATVSIHVVKPIDAGQFKHIQLDFGVDSGVSTSAFTQIASTPATPQIEDFEAPDYVGRFTVSEDGKHIVYEPSPDFIGSFSVNYTVRYGPEDYQFVTGGRHYQVVNAFWAVDNWYSVEPESNENRLNLLENDPAWIRRLHGVRRAPVELSVASISAGSEGGQIRIAEDGKSVFYKPAAGFTGDETFTYEVLASNGARDSATVTVHVAEQVADPSGVDRFVNEAELQQLLIDKAVARYLHQFGISSQRYALSSKTYLQYEHFSAVIAADTDSLSGNATGYSSHSETNTQVAGVDEADIVETDGRYVYTFTSGKLVVVDVSDPTTPTPVSFTEFEGRFDLMYLQGNRMTLLRNGSQWGGGAEVLVLDISDRTAPTVIERTEFDGYISDSRAIGDRVHLVVKHAFLVPELEGKWLVEPIPPTESSQKTQRIPNYTDGLITLDLAYPWYPIDRGEPGIWQNESLDEYVDRVRDSLIDTGLPSFRSYDANGELIDLGLLTDATSVHKPVAGSDLLVSLVTIDAGDDAVGPLAAATSFVSDSNTEVFVSGESAYVFAFNAQTNKSTVYKLSFEEDGLTPIVASGTIGGRLLNQFSADVYEGYLRVATTETRSELTETSWGRRRLQRRIFNNVIVLEQQGNQLQMVGEVTNLAPTETIHSVRFMGDRAYVVTFRRVDPLFALDMSDPTAPTVEGVLKIPGFSNYLHPVGSDYLIGIGRDANEITGRLGALQITLFNVSDLSDPHVADQLTFEGANWVDSEAWIEHHAVSFFAESGILAIPISWSESIELEGEAAIQYGRYQTENHSAIWTVKVDTESSAGASLEVTGSVEHEAASYGWNRPISWGTVPINSWWGLGSYDPGSPARRALRVGESLITVSNEYVKINNLLDPNIQLGEVYLGQLAEDDSFEIDEDSGINILDVTANDRVDPGRESGKIIGFSQPTQGGTVEFSNDDETLLFTADQDFFGRISFTYTTYDEVRGEETANVYLTVSNIPDDPTAVDDEFSVDVNSSSTVLNVLENDINPDKGSGYYSLWHSCTCIVGDCESDTFRSSNIIKIDFTYGSTNDLRIKEIGDPDQRGTLELDMLGRVLYTPSEGFEGIETFTYTITTKQGRTDTGTVTLFVGGASVPVQNAITDLSLQKAAETQNGSLEQSKIGQNIVPQESLALESQAKSGTLSADFIIEAITSDEQEPLRFSFKEEVSNSLALDLALFHS